MGIYKHSLYNFKGPLRFDTHSLYDSTELASTLNLYDSNLANYNFRQKTLDFVLNNLPEGESQGFVLNSMALWTYS